MKQSLQRIIGLSVLVSQLVACGINRKPVTQHDNMAEPGKLSAPVDDSVTVKVFEQANADEYLDKTFTAKTADELFKNVLQPLRTLVLNKKFIEHPRWSQSEQFVSLFHAFQTAMVRWLELKPGNTPADRALSQEWLNTILSECNAELNVQTCVNFPVFWRDRQNSSSLMISFLAAQDKILDTLIQKLPAQEQCWQNEECKRELNQLYNYFSVTEAVKNSRVSNTADRLVIKYAPLRLAQLNNSNSKGFLARRTTLIFELVKSRLNVGENKEQFRDILDTKSVYLNSLGSQSTVGRSLLELAVGNFLYQCNGDMATKDGVAVCEGKTVLSANFSKALDEVLHRGPSQDVEVDGDLEQMTEKQKEEYKQKQTAIFFQKSFTRIIEEIKNDKRGDVKPGLEMLANLNLNSEVTRDEYLFLVHALFYNDMDLATARSFWFSSSQDKARLNQVIQQFLQMFMVRLIMVTNDYMNRVYQDYGQQDPNSSSNERGKASENLIRSAINKSDVLNALWTQFLQRVDTLTRFIDQNLAEDLAVQDIKDQLNKIRTTIKLTSVFPNMIMMIYFLHEVKWEITIWTFFGPFKFNAALIAEFLFNGKLSPWLSFGLGRNDSSSLDRFAVLNSFHYTLAMETFSAFANLSKLDKESIAKNRPANVDEFQFFDQVVKTYFQENVDSLTGARDYLLKFTRHGEYYDAAKICDELLPEKNTFRLTRESIDKIGVFRQGLTTYADEREFNTIDDYLFLSDPTSTSGPMHRLIDLYGALWGYLRDLRSNLNPKINYAKLLISVTENHLIKKIKQAKPEDRAELKTQTLATISKIKAIIDEVTELQKQVNTYAYKIVNEGSRCPDVVSLVNRKRLFEMLSAERLHLENVFVWLSILSENSLKDKTLTEVVAEVSKLTDWKQKYYSLALKPMLESQFYALNSEVPFSLALNNYFKLVLNDPRVPVLNNPEAKDEKNRYLGYDGIELDSSNASYRYSKLDFLMRTLQRLRKAPDNGKPQFQSEIEPLAPTTRWKVTNLMTEVQSPQFTVSLPVARTAFANEESFKAARNDFISQGMKAVGGQFVSWPSKAIHLASFKKRMDLLLELYLQGPKPIYNNGCKKGYSLIVEDPKSVKLEEAEPFCRKDSEGLYGQITPNDIFNDWKTTIETLSLSVEDLTALNLLGTTGKMGYYDNFYLKSYFLDSENINKRLKFFDYPFSYLVESSKNRLNEPEYFYDSIKNAGKYLFPIDENINKLTKCNYWLEVDHYEKVNKEFVSYFDEREKTDQLVTTYDDSLEKVGSENFSPYLRFGVNSEDFVSADFGGVLYIDPTIKSNFSNYMAQYHDSMDGFYDPTNKKETYFNGEKKTAFHLYFNKQECSTFYDIPEEVWNQL